MRKGKRIAILTVACPSRSLDFPQGSPTNHRLTDISLGVDNSHSTTIHSSKIHGKRMEATITKTLRTHLQTTGHRTSSMGTDLLEQQRDITNQIRTSATSRKELQEGTAEALLLMGMGTSAILLVPETRFLPLRPRKDSHRVVLPGLRVSNAQNLVRYPQRHLIVKDHPPDNQLTFISSTSKDHRDSNISRHSRVGQSFPYIPYEA